MDTFSIDHISDKLSAYAYQFQHNVWQSLGRLTYKQYLRLLIFICAYALLRPYLVKLGARFQRKDHEREIDPHEMTSSAAAISPNSLRGQVQVPEDTDSEGEEDAGKSGNGAGTGASANWGKKARRRQRKMIRQLLEAEAQKRMEEEEAESDKDIEEFLVN